MTKIRTLAALLALASVRRCPPARCSAAATAAAERAAAPQPRLCRRAELQRRTGAPNAGGGADAGHDPLRAADAGSRVGMYRGHVDGVWGPGTQAGVRSYPAAAQHRMRPDSSTRRR